MRSSKSGKSNGIVGGKYNEQTVIALGSDTLIATACKGVIRGMTLCGAVHDTNIMTPP
jgi:hypothetical protein